MRVSPYALKVIRRAAEIQGRSISDFVVAAAQEVAERAFERTRIIRDSIAYHESFTKALSTTKPDRAPKRAL